MDKSGKISEKMAHISIENQNLSATNIYTFEWNELLSSLSNNLEILRQSAFNGDLKVSKFRSICWSLLLRVLNENSNTWKEQREQQRRRYGKLKNEFVKNPHKISDKNDDPLSQSQQSIWNQYFGDQELFSVIKQDVVRTFPGVDFFRKSTIQEAMTNILFFYAREHPWMCYRQGMHEILAPILFVMHSDHQALLHFKEITNDIDDVLFDTLNPKYLEADSYSLFSRLMSSIESYYRITNMMPTPGGYFPTQSEPISPSYENTPYTNEVEVIGQLNFIRDKILAKEDLHLHNHFLKLDIPLHIFGIRWLRLLFGREFPLQDLLVLWDAIFADSDRFELPNFILVAMLIRIRDKLLLRDYTSCLTLLMKYPNNVDIGLILRHALHMRMPTKFNRPNDAFIYVKIKSDHQPNHKLNKSATALTNTTLQRQQSVKLSENSSTRFKFEQRNRSSSLSSDCIMKDMQATNAVVGPNSISSHHNLDIQSSDLKVVDGYRENSLEALRAELQIAQNIMSLSRQKLKKYLFIIKQHIPPPNSNHHHSTDDLNQALTGIEELCSFLDVKFIETNELSAPLQPVDSALEAAEAAGQVKQIPKVQHHQVLPLPITSDVLLNTHQGSDVLEQLKPTTKNFSTEIQINKTEKNSKDKHHSVENFAHLNRVETATLIAHTTTTSTANKTRYEIPDNSFMRYSSKLLGTKKDFELKLFKSEHCQDDEALGGIPIPDPLGIRDA